MMQRNFRLFFAPQIVADHMQKKIGKLRPAKTVPKIMIIKVRKKMEFILYMYILFDLHV